MIALDYGLNDLCRDVAPSNAGKAKAHRRGLARRLTPELDRVGCVDDIGVDAGFGVVFELDPVERVDEVSSVRDLGGANLRLCKRRRRVVFGGVAKPNDRQLAVARRDQRTKQGR